MSSFRNRQRVQVFFDKREVFADFALVNGSLFIVDDGPMTTSLPAHSRAYQAARLLAVGFEGTTLSTELRALLDRGISGVILFSRNVESPAQVARLIAEIKDYASHVVYVGVDQEGGVVQRLRSGFTRLPNMRTLEG